MLKFTPGSKQAINYDDFDGVVAGFHLRLWNDPKITTVPNKIYRSQFLYGNKKQVPHPNSKCNTLLELTARDVAQCDYIHEWVLINEFTDDLGVPYPGFKLDDLKRYFETAHLANPAAKLILADFRPFLIKKWDAIASISEALKAEGFPIEIGIQTHLKFVASNLFKWNAPLVVALLPDLIKKFSVPVHIIEASLWYESSFDRIVCQQLWEQLIRVAEENQVKSFCQWWLYPEDVSGYMPTFKDMNLYTDYLVQ